MSAQLITAAPTRNTGSVKRRHRRIARAAICLTGAQPAIVVLTPADAKDEGVFASRVARAWNQLIDEAEQRHRDYWAAREGL